jgi:hypothetical protein
MKPPRHLVVFLQTLFIQIIDGVIPDIYILV